MDIAIIGSGNIGGTLARRLTAAGHRVAIAGRTPERTLSVARDTGATAATSATEAAAGADVIFLAVPWDAIEGLAGELAPVAAGKIVVDVTNPARPDFSGPLFAGAGSGADRIAAWLPGAGVVKAFNTIFAANLAGDGRRDGVRLDALVAGDDPEARSVVLRLAADLGFVPIDAGQLPNAAFLEALAWLNISLNIANGWPWQTGWKFVGAPAAALEAAA